MMGKSLLTNLTVFYDKMTGFLAKRRALNTIYLISKAFEIVSQSFLLKEFPSSNFTEI